MASKARGQPIVTNLLGSIVAPRDATAAETHWPEDWKMFSETTAPIHLDQPEPRRAEVVAVYAHEGDVWFLLRNVLDDKLTQSAAEYWRIITSPK